MQWAFWAYPEHLKYAMDAKDLFYRRHESVYQDAPQAWTYCTDTLQDFEIKKNIYHWLLQLKQVGHGHPDLPPPPTVKSDEKL